MWFVTIWKFAEFLSALTIISPRRNVTSSKFFFRTNNAHIFICLSGCKNKCLLGVSDMCSMFFKNKAAETESFKSVQNMHYP